MNSLDSALTDGPGEILLSLFTLFPRKVASEAPKIVGEPAPAVLRTYLLDDLEDHYPGWECFEYDLVFETLPKRVELCIHSWMQKGIAAGASLVWFGFEGSFSFEELVSAAIAPQIYAVANASQVHVAVGHEYRRSESWARVLDDVARESGVR